MGRHTLLLLVVVLSLLWGCGREKEGDIGRRRAIPSPPPTGGFGALQLAPQRGQVTAGASSPATGGGGSCWANPTLGEYTLAGGKVGEIAAGDGSVWFTTTGPAIAHLTPTGQTVGYAVPPPKPMPFSEGTPRPSALTVGPDGAVWFTEPLANQLGRIDVHSLTITEHPIPSEHTGVPPGIVAAGPDRALWFNGGAALGRMTTSGAVRWFPLPATGNPAPTSVAAGPDGRLWTIDRRHGQVLRMTSQGQVGELAPVADPTGLTSAGLRQLSAGPDAVWFAEPSLNRIGRYACPGGA